jgi:hypothetical protein
VRTKLKSQDIMRETGLSKASVARLAKEGKIPGAYRVDGCHFAFPNTQQLRNWISEYKGKRGKPVEISTESSACKIQSFPSLVDAKALAVALFPDPASRPCLRTIRRWQDLRLIPYLKVGKKVFFDPVQVRRALDARFTISAK